MKIKCIEKKRYGTIAQAKDHLRSLYISKGARAGIYECTICRDFHVTRQPSYELINWYAWSIEFRNKAFHKWFPHWERKHANILIKKAYKELKKTHKSYRRVLEPVVISNKRARKLKYKSQMLPLALQKKLIAELHN